MAWHWPELISTASAAVVDSDGAETTVAMMAMYRGAPPRVGVTHAGIASRCC